jgi:hypothetical protein
MQKWEREREEKQRSQNLNCTYVSFNFHAINKNRFYAAAADHSRCGEEHKNEGEQKNKFKKES